jgi:ribosomal protein S18 acetylase RimI-like enzyme
VDPILIRRAAPADNTLLSEIGARTFYATFAADNKAENMQAFLRATYSPDKQALELAEADSQFLIAEVGGVAVGYARLKAGVAPAPVVGRRPIEIARIYSEGEWIGRGVGPALMEACLAEADERGCDVVWLGVWGRNPRAIAFYRKWGFEVVGSHIFQFGDDPQRDLLMARPAGMGGRPSPDDGSESTARL